MTRVKYPEIFKSMSTVSVQSNSHTRKEYLCMYDSKYSKKYSHPHVYRKGTCTKELLDGWNVLYEDAYLDDKYCVWLGYMHYPIFKNQFIAMRLMQGHEHLKCFVSSNDISIKDSMRIDDKKNIVFSGELCEGMPFRHKYFGAFSLYVIDAELSPEKLAIGVEVESQF